MNKACIRTTINEQTKTDLGDFTDNRIVNQEKTDMISEYWASNVLMYYQTFDLYFYIESHSVGIFFTLVL
jgi:predicted ester cyclase